MNKTAVLCTLLFASLSPGFSSETNSLEYIVREKGLHHRKLERVHSKSMPNGQSLTITNSYFELATGMYRLEEGQLVAADPEIEIQLLGGAAANHTRHQLTFGFTVGDIE